MPREPLAAPPPLPETVRAGLPRAVQAYLAALERSVAALSRRLAELEARQQQDSRSSSRPPSSDPPWKRWPPQPPSGRRRGGQPGHAGHARPVREPEAVDAVVEHWPRVCPHCATTLEDTPEVGEPERQQVCELPERRAQLTEQRLHAVRCPGCRRVVRATRPPETGQGAFGPRLSATVGLLHGRYRLSAREVVALLADSWQVSLSLGSVAQLCARVAAALAAPVAQVQAAVQRAPALNVDETGWRQGRQKRWLWTASTPEQTLFRLTASRAATELEPLLGAQFAGVVGSDRYRVYDTLPTEQRAVCWSHLKRDFAGWALWGGELGAWGRALLEQERALFALWHRFRQGVLTRPALLAEALPIQQQVRTLLEQGQQRPPTRGFCRNLLRLWPALWTFLEREGVEPTNNAAEQALRPAVLWRKGCGGTQSETGDRFVERILTVAATCRQQGRNLQTYLTDAVRAQGLGLAPPPLLAPP